MPSSSSVGQKVIGSKKVPKPHFFGLPFGAVSTTSGCWVDYVRAHASDRIEISPVSQVLHGNLVEYDHSINTRVAGWRDQYTIAVAQTTEGVRVLG